MKNFKVLVVDDDDSVRKAMHFALQDNFDVTVSQDGLEAIERLYKEHFDIILLDIRMPRLNGIEALKRIQKIAPETDVVMLTATVNSDITSSVLQLGAINYLTKPFEMEELIALLNRLARKKQIIDKSNRIQDQILESKRIGELVGQTELITTIRAYTQEIAPTSFSVLIEGEKGVELDIVAYMLFQGSPYKDVFKSINCASSNINLEEELFGNASDDKEVSDMPVLGFIKIGKGGTLYLKNIERLPSYLQPRLATWLDTKRRFATDEKDIRLIVGTTVALSTMVDEYGFDRDLYQLINEKLITIPPVHHRQDDIPLLIDHYLHRYNKEFGKDCNFTPTTYDILCKYRWPGNIAEINCSLRRMVLLTEKVIDLDVIPMNVLIGSVGYLMTVGLDYDTYVAGFVSLLISSLMEEYKGNKDVISTILGVSNQRLEELMQKSGFVSRDTLN